jgi:hypothetical protein
MLEGKRLATNLKYPWQEAVLDALKEDKPERWPGKIAEAERAVSARLIEEVANPDERLALRGAVIALECLRHPTIDKW